MASESLGKKLSDLRVVDLRLALEKRALEKTGNKSILIERLTKVLTEEGLDPNNYNFDQDCHDGSAPSEQEGSARDRSQNSISEEDHTEIDHHDDEEGESATELSYCVQDEARDQVLDQEGRPMVELDSIADSDGQMGASHGDLGNSFEQPEGDISKIDEEMLDNREETTEEGELRDIEEEPNSPMKEEIHRRAANYSEDAEPEDPLEVHVDESDTNLDYDLGDRTEERDAPTPTKDEMDMAGDVVTDGCLDAAGATAIATKTSSAVTTSKCENDKIVEAAKKENKDLAASQNLWISGLSSSTRATDLKAVFSKYGKVVGAKVVTNANKPGSKCYGYVTMSSADEAAKCIQHLHRTDLHGRMISVERAKSDPAAQARAANNGSGDLKPLSSTSTNDKKHEEAKSTSSSTTGAKDVSTVKEGGVTEKEKHPEVRHRGRVTLTGGSTIKRDEAKVKKEAETREVKPVDKDIPRPTDKPEDPLERERRRLRILERRMKDDELRRRAAMLREKRQIAEQARRLKMEETRILRDRERMRQDREKMKIEALEVERLERERARLEKELHELRQRVDREREELRRAETLRIEEMRRATMKRTFDSVSRNTGREEYGWEAKRPTPSDRSVAMTAQPIMTKKYIGKADERFAERPSEVVLERPVYGRRSEGGPRGGDMPHKEERRTSVVASDRAATAREDPRRPPADERYGGKLFVRNSSGGERREIAAVSRSSPSRRDWKDPVASRAPREKAAAPVHHGNGGTRGGWSESRDKSSWSSSGSRGAGDTRHSWGGSGQASSSDILSGQNSDIFSGAAVQAAGMMMSAALSRGGTSGSARFSGSGGGGFGGARRY